MDLMSRQTSPKQEIIMGDVKCVFKILGDINFPLWWAFVISGDKETVRWEFLHHRPLSV